MPMIGFHCYVMCGLHGQMDDDIDMSM